MSCLSANVLITDTNTTSHILHYSRSCCKQHLQWRHYSNTKTTKNSKSVVTQFGAKFPFKNCIGINAMCLILSKYNHSVLALCIITIFNIMCYILFYCCLFTWSPNDQDILPDHKPCVWCLHIRNQGSVSAYSTATWLLPHYHVRIVFNWNASSMVWISGI